MDTFYIDDPTLAFINCAYWKLVFIFSELTVYLVNTRVQTFTYAEYLSLAMAKVWAGKADLPCTTELWRRYDKVVKDRGGYGKDLQFLDAERSKGKLVFTFALFWNSIYFFQSCIAIFPGLAQRWCCQIWWEAGELYSHLKFLPNEADTRYYRLDWWCSRVRIFVMKLFA